MGQINTRSLQASEKSDGSLHKNILQQKRLLLKNLEMVDQIMKDNLLREELDEYSATKLLEILDRLVTQIEISIKELKDLVADGKIFGEHSDVNPASDLDRSIGPKIADSVFPRESFLFDLDETVDEEPLTAVAKLETSNDVAKVKAGGLESKPNPGNRAHPKEDLDLSLENLNKLSQLEGSDSAIEKKIMDHGFEIVDYNGLPNKEEEQDVTTNLPIPRPRRLTRSIPSPTSDQANQNPNNQQELTINETTEERASNDQVENDDKPSEQPETFPAEVSLLSDSENNLPSELPNKEEEQEVTTNLPSTRIPRSRRLTRSIQSPTSDQSNQNPNNQEELIITETTEERASNDQVENEPSEIRKPSETKPSEQPETFPSKVSLLSDSENNLPSELKSFPPTPILSTEELPTKTLLPQAESSGRVKDEEVAKSGFSGAKNFFRNQERQSMRQTKPEDLVQRKTAAEIEKIRKKFEKAEIAELK